MPAGEQIPPPPGAVRDRLEDEFPGRLTVEVTLRHQLVCSHRGMDKRLLAVMVDDLVGGGGGRAGGREAMK